MCGLNIAHKLLPGKENKNSSPEVGDCVCEESLPVLHVPQCDGTGGRCPHGTKTWSTRDKKNRSAQLPILRCDADKNASSIIPPPSQRATLCLNGGLLIKAGGAGTWRMVESVSGCIHRESGESVKNMVSLLNQ